MALKDLFFTKEEHEIKENIVPVVETHSSLEVEISDVSSPTQIYEASSIEESNNSIYKCVAFIEGLPSSLDSIGKKEVLQKMLAAAGLDVGMLYIDASNRMEILDNYASGYVNTFNSDVDRIDGQIAELKSAIEMLEEEKKVKFANTEEQVKIVKEEIARLKSLQSYVETGKGE